jgi:hypothetical protein
MNHISQTIADRKANIAQIIEDATQDRLKAQYDDSGVFQESGGKTTQSGS